jgi:hypothetical protein
MPIDHRQFERDFEAMNMATPDNFDPLKVAIDAQLALERYKINEEARANAEVYENRNTAFAFGLMLGLAIMYIIGYLTGHV